MRILIFLLLSTSLFANRIMISPAGDAINPGRSLDMSYERGIALQMAESLQKKIESRYDCNCILTRGPGERVEELQSPSFANRLGAKFYLSIHVCREPESIKPRLSVYHLVYNSMVDLATHRFSPYEFLPVNKAHLANASKSKSFAEKLGDIISNSHGRRIDFRGPYGIPFKPLRGILAPAIAIEVGLNKEKDWKSLIDPIVDSLRFLLSL